MTNRKICELPAAPYKTLAIEAQRRGVALAEGSITGATDTILIGVLDIIRELSERIETLEVASTVERIIE